MENNELDQLLGLADLESVLGKKTAVYGRLLTDPALAKEMEERAARHAQRAENLSLLALGKPLKKKNGQGRDAMNGEATEK